MLDSTYSMPLVCHNPDLIRARPEQVRTGIGTMAPPFDRDISDGFITPEVVDCANAIVDSLRAKKVHEIVISEPPLGLTIPNLVRCYLQAHIRRCLVFIDAGVAELGAGRPLAAELCTRALYENIANICNFADKMKPLCKAADYTGVEALVTKSAFSTRIPSLLQRHGDDLQAPQILNQIDKMAKRFPTFRENYDRLSDIVHPNGLGAVVYFAKMEFGRAEFIDEGRTPAQARISLIMAVILMAFVEAALVELEECLQNLSATISARHTEQRHDAE
jgi:hypothetical protein